jgi:hypothetical protein
MSPSSHGRDAATTVPLIECVDQPHWSGIDRLRLLTITAPERQGMHAVPSKDGEASLVANSRRTGGRLGHRAIDDPAGNRKGDYCTETGGALD